MTREELKQLEADLWSAADNLRANSDLKSTEYSIPVADGKDYRAYFVHPPFPEILSSPVP
jgi:hypothetical protein